MRLSKTIFKVNVEEFILYVIIKGMLGSKEIKIAGIYDRCGKPVDVIAETYLMVDYYNQIIDSINKQRALL